MEVSVESEKLTACINKLKRNRQRMLTGQRVQATALLPVRRYIKDKDAQQRLGMHILELVVSDDEFTALHALEQQSVLVLFEACKAYLADQSMGMAWPLNLRMLLLQPYNQVLNVSGYMPHAAKWITIYYW